MSYATFNIATATYIGAAFTSDTSKAFNIDDLEDGNYSIFSVWINSCGTKSGEVSEALDITVESGVITSMPSHDPTNIRINNEANGEFKIRWDYKNLLRTDTHPTVFYIYDDINPSTHIGQTTYNSDFSRFSFSTTENYTDELVVTFTVKAVNSIYIKEPGISITGIADSEGPNIVIESESIELI